MEDGNSFPLALVMVPAFLVFFAAMWLGVNALLSAVSGWSALASRYRFEGEFGGEKWSWQSAQMGWVGIRGVLTAGANREGLYLAMMPLFRFRHPPLFVPWRDVAVAEKRMLFFKGVQFQLGREEGVKLWVRAGLGENLRRASGG